MAMGMSAQTGKKVKTVELTTGYQFHFEKDTQDLSLIHISEPTRRPG